MDSSPPGISPGRLLLIYGVALVTLFVLVPGALYFILDPERLDLDDAVRKSAAGQFARLSDGYTHTYEIHARWLNADGQAMDQTRNVEVQPGQAVNVNFN